MFTFFASGWEAAVFWHPLTLSHLSLSSLVLSTQQPENQKPRILTHWLTTIWTSTPTLFSSRSALRIDHNNWTPSFSWNGKLCRHLCTAKVPNHDDHATYEFHSQNDCEGGEWTIHNLLDPVIHWLHCRHGVSPKHKVEGLPSVGGLTLMLLAHIQQHNGEYLSPHTCIFI